MSFWDQATVVITGGTGSFGHGFTRLLLETEPDLAAIRIISRDEYKQSEMAQRITDPRVKFLIGDVRDAQRLRRAFAGVDVVVHAAAMKQVPACEYDPLECKKTNIDGAANVIEAALDQHVPKVMALSTDKAVAPLNAYGKSKAFAESLFVAANAYAGRGPTRFSVVRYGNVAGSRGSIIPLLLAQRAAGNDATVTDERMTRFWFTLGDAARFTKRAIEDMHGGEIFVPKLPSVRIPELVTAVVPGATVRITGIRAGEKFDEVLICAEESPRAIEHEDRYVLAGGWRDQAFTYDSGANRFLSVDEIRAAIPRALAEAALGGTA